MFVLLKSHTFLAGIILSSPLLLLALSYLTNANIINRLLSIGNAADSSTAYRIDIWIGTWRMLSDKGAYGIGIGEGAFSSVFPQYALSGTEAAPHTHSLYLQIMAETGIVSLLSFLLICFAYLSLVFAYIRKSPGMDNRTFSIGFVCSICAFLIQGITDYSWYNYRVYLFFWVMLGFAMAAINLCKENDRRKFTYE
jgi:O-antigen ligase